MVISDSLEPYEVLMPLAPWEPPSIVKEALASLACQIHPPQRVVVSCDGPPSPALRHVLASTPLPLVILEGPGGEGIGPVLARGIQQCRCELLLRADADDLSLPERALHQVEAMVARPNLAALSAPIMEFVDDPEHPCSLRSVPVDPGQLWGFSRWRNPLNHPATVLRRQAVLAVGNYRDCPGFEDYDLWLRLLHSGGEESLANLPVPLVKARVGRDHLSRRQGLAYAGQEFRFLVRAAREGLLPGGLVLLLIVLRLPLRLLPPHLLLIVMRLFTRQRVGT